MPTTPANVRAMLADSVPNPPYVKRPTYTELIAAIDRAVTSPGVQLAELAKLLRDDTAATVWFKRHTALRLALVSHYTTEKRHGANYAKSCNCASCRKWRPEFEALNAAKAAAPAPA